MAYSPAPARRALSFLNEHDRLRQLAAHVQELVALQRAWTAVAPAALASASRIGQADAGLLTVYCDNGAAAAKLRQLLPTLTGSLRARGVAVSGLQIKVRAQALPDRSRILHKPQISRAGLENLAQLRDGLAEGELKSALDHLLARHGVKSGQ